jgi:hypothetical protein
MQILVYLKGRREPSRETASAVEEAQKKLRIKNETGEVAAWFAMATVQGWHRDDTAGKMRFDVTLKRRKTSIAIFGSVVEDLAERLCVKDENGEVIAVFRIAEIESFHQRDEDAFKRDEAERQQQASLLALLPTEVLLELQDLTVKQLPIPEELAQRVRAVLGEHPEEKKPDPPAK